MTLTPFNKPVFTLPCPPVGTVRGRTCRKSTFDRIILALNSSFTAEEMRSLLTEISPDTDFGIMGLTGARLFLGEYRNAVEKYCEDNVDIFGIPKAFGTDSGGHCRLPVITYAERLVYEHSGLNFFQIAELDVLDYRMLLADAVKYRILQREDGKGREFLNECYSFMHRESSLFE